MKNLTIGKRIVLSFAVMLVVTIAAGILVFLRLREIRRASTTIVDNSIPGIYLIERIETEATLTQLLVHQHMLAEHAGEMVELDAQITATRERVTALYSAYENTITDDENRTLFEKTKSFRPGYLARRDEVLAISRSGRKQEASGVAQENLAPYFEDYMKSVRSLVDLNKRNADLGSVRITKAMTGIQSAMAGAIAAVMLVSVGAGAYLVRDTNRKLNRVAAAMEESSAHVAAAARQVSASSKTLADGTSEQAASLEETSASLEQVASMTKHNAEGAQQAKELSGQARAAADSGATTMGAMKQAMDEIKNSSNDISKIIKTIDEIAFQTNILALNAAVEAARAGEAGMGFAVVAEEVRSLAQRSAQSARETAEKIEVAIAKSEHGATLSYRVGQSLTEIVDKARRVDALVAEIATASGEQTRGIDQVHLAVNQMDKVTQASAGSAEETAAAATELDTQAARMRENVVALQQLVGGGATKSPATAKTAAVPGPGSAAMRAPESVALVGT